MKTHTVSWSDPYAVAEAARSLSGLEFFQKAIAGELPFAPIGSLFGFAIVEAENGRVVFAATPAEYHFNPIGTVHGGFAATLLDSATACAVHTTLPLGKAYTTLELKVNYVRPIVLQTGPMRCIGQVIHPGRRVATSEARLVDAGGKLYAHATSTCLIFDLEA
ncbi:MAG: PaaI family thioesterase [Anaerolineales bacterium]|nr:PaaI family thioesterase [Anaerolineales bacterium]